MMIWLNQAATTFPKPPKVYEERDRIFRQGLGAQGRSSGESDFNTQKIYKECKQLLADLFSTSSKHVFFTAGATEALNIVFANTPHDSCVLSTQSRHNAVRRAVSAYGFSEILLPPLRLENYQELLTKQLKPHSLLVLNACSNVDGSCEPIKEICAFVKKYHASVRIAVDGCQAAGHMPLDMNWGIDYLAVTAHKALFGPPALGSLITPHHIKPLIFGGTGSDSRSLIQSTEGGLFESGTRDISSLAAWSEGLRFVKEVGLDAIRTHEDMLKKTFLAAINDLPLKVYSNEGSIVTLVSDCYSSEEIALLMEDQGVVIRGGLHCAPDMHDFLGNKGAARFSFSYFNTVEDINTAAKILASIFEEES